MREDKQYTQFWFADQIDQWLRWVPAVVNDALEVGSFEGASAGWLLDNRPESTITCIDIFGQTFDDITGTYEDRFDANLAEYGDRVIKIKEYSDKALLALAEEEKSYDFIYVDGDHSFSGALSDARLSWPLLRVDGVLIFDDYKNDRFGVHDAVDEFIAELEPDTYELLRNEDDYQSAIRRLKI